MTSRANFIDYLIDNYPKDITVLEIGAGHYSTKILSENFQKLYSIESDSKYIGIYNSNYIHVPIDNKTFWYDFQIFETKIPKDYDLLILDGPLGGFNDMYKNSDFLFRLGFCQSYHAIKKNIPIIVDDTKRDWRERQVVEFLKSKNYSVLEFDNFCVCNPD